MRGDTPFFQSGSSIGPYRLVQAPHASTRSNILPLGSGGTSFVYLVDQTLGSGTKIRRALKLFSSASNIKAKNREVGKTYGAHHFLDEIEAISSINHQNIIKIIDAGTDDDARPYFVMELASGDTLEAASRSGENGSDWRKQVSDDPFLVLAIAQQICWALAYLHENKRYHFDIAPKNIFVSFAHGRVHVLLGDLGVSRSIQDVPGGAREDQMIPIAGTREYTPVEVEPFREQGEAPLSVLAKYAAHWDLYALAKLIMNLAKSWGLERHGDLVPLFMLCDSIMIFDEQRTASTVASQLERLLPSHVLTAGVEEISSDAYGKRRYISIPLGSIPISQRVSDLIGHPALTRLQRVPQLLLYRSVTPGGVHTTFENMLGSYGNMLRCLTKLLSLPRFRVAFDRKELEEALIATILLKVTTFPLDRILYSIRPLTSEQKKSAIRKAVCNKGPARASLGSLVNEYFPACDIESVVSILTEPVEDQKYPYRKLISSLLRSSLDVRVMDYIVRDSYHTGIPAGMGVDIANIIENLVWSDSTGRLGVSRTGVLSVEHMLCARYWMFVRLYWNQPNRATTAMLRHVMYRIISVVPASYLSIELSNVDELGALKILRHHVEMIGEKHDDGTIMALLEQARPRAYKLLLELFSRNWTNDRLTGRAAMKRCNTLDAEDLENLREGYMQHTAIEIPPSFILFDLPNEFPLKLGEDINVEIEKGHELPLQDVSDIIKILPETFFENAVRLRVFYHPDLSSELVGRLRNEVKEFLDTKFLS